MSHGGLPHIDLLNDELYSWSPVRSTPVKQVECGKEATGRKPGVISDIDKFTRDKNLADLLLQSKKKKEPESEQSDNSTSERDVC